MKFEKLVVGPLASNCYILYDEETRETIIVDPGDEASKIITKINELSLLPKEVWLTHGHFDHLGAANTICKEFNIEIYLNDEDYPIYKAWETFSEKYRVEIEEPPAEPNFFNMAVKERKVGSYSIEIIHTPGHSPGSVCFYSRDINSIFVGDLIFELSVGRTDLPGASFEVLEKSIRDSVYSKGDSCIVHPGHGDETMVGREKKMNPFVKEK